MDPFLREFLLWLAGRAGHEPAGVEDRDPGVCTEVIELLGREHERTVVSVYRHLADGSSKAGYDEGCQNALKQHGALVEVVL